MKHALFLSALLAALPVQADDADKMEFFTYFYAREGRTATAQWQGDVPLAAEDKGLMVQSKQLEIKDTQGRPVQLSIRPAEQKKGVYMLQVTLEGLAPDAAVEWQGSVDFALPEQETTTCTLSPEGGVLGRGKAQMVYRFLQMNGANLLEMENPGTNSVDDLSFTYQDKPFQPQLVAKGKKATGGGVFLFHILATEGLSVTFKEQVAGQGVKKSVPISVSLKPREGATGTPAPIGDFSLVDYQHVMIGGTDAMAMILLSPVLAEGEVAVHFDTNAVNSPVHPFAVGSYRTYEGSPCSIVLGMDGVPAEATLPVDVSIPADLLQVGKTTLDLQGAIPLPPAMSVQPARSE